MPDYPGEGGASSRESLRPDPRRVHQTVILPQHVAGRVQGHRPSLHLVSQEEFQDLVMHTLSRHVCGFPPSPIMQLQVCAVKQEESGRVIATIGGRKEERRLTLSEKGESRGLTEKSLMSVI